MNDCLELVLDGGAAIWQQLVRQIGRLVLSGALRPGEELPSVRAVAVGLAVNPRAVEQAYDRLEWAGLVSRLDGSGPRVAGPFRSAAEVNLEQICELFSPAAAERGHSSATFRQAPATRLEREVSYEQAD